MNHLTRMKGEWWIDNTGAIFTEKHLNNRLKENDIGVFISESTLDKTIYIMFIYTNTYDPSEAKQLATRK